jgi:hypothetical protein
MSAQLTTVLPSRIVMPRWHHAPVTRVYLENGKTWTFACSLDWPGWCRRGKGEDAALQVLLDYAPRYRAVAGRGWKPGELTVVGRIPGDVTTDFGAPHVVSPWDEKPLPKAKRTAQLDLLRSCWTYFDKVVDGAPASLRQGPRGGGRDRDKMVDHVREAERSYARKIGVAAPPRTPWEEQRGQIVDGLEANPSETAWPWPYVVRRMAWHVLDHAWEIEDRSEPS